MKVSREKAELLLSALAWWTNLVFNTSLQLTLRDRLQLTMPTTHNYCPRMQVFLKKISRDKDGLPFFSIGKYKVYFDIDVDYSDKDSFLKGITLILMECFADQEYCFRKFPLKSGQIAFDVGAFIGTNSMLMAEMVGNGGKVYSFEPVTFSILAKNIQANKISNVETTRLAISDFVGHGIMRISDFYADSSILKRQSKSKECEKSITTDVTTLDSFCETNDIDRVDFIKMDIEGAEEQAIRGARRVIENCHPAWSISSYHHDSSNEPQHPKLVRLLKSFNYSIVERRNNHIWVYHK